MFCLIHLFMVFSGTVFLVWLAHGGVGCHKTTSSIENLIVHQDKNNLVFNSVIAGHPMLYT